MLRPLLLVLLLIVPVAAQGQQADPREVLSAAVDGFIRPGYERLSRDAEIMALAGADLCAAPSADALDAAREAFAALVAGWSRIEIVRFGPVIEDNRLERLFFFPDRRGIGLRQVQGALAARDPDVVNPVRLAEKSVALQGLTTLEYLLHGTGADALASGDDHRCRFAESVAARIHATSVELAAAWDAEPGIGTRLADPHAANADFRTVDESLAAVLGIFIHASELVADVRLRPFLGETPDKANSRLAPFWRSGLTRTSLEGNLDGMQHLYDVSGIAQLLPPPIRLEADAVTFEFGNGRRALAGPDGELADAAMQAEARQSLVYFGIVVRSLRRIFQERLAEGLGLAAGFSALDGD